MVERDGVPILVDDDRMPLAPGEIPEERVRFRTLGCYPLTGAIESSADTLLDVIQEMLLTTHLRAPRPRDRPRRHRLDGEEEAGGLFLMAHADRLIAENIEAYLRRHQHKTLLRFITCGSVDDGKSTLIGRLLYESKLVFEDHLATLEADSKKVGTQGGDLDFALLVDGLAAEREQGITIDVAYRFFPPRRASSSSPIPLATSSTHATWSPVRPPQTWPSSWSTPVRESADSDAPPHLPGVAPWHPPHCARSEQARPGRLLARGVRPDRYEYRAFAAELGLGAWREHPDLCAPGRQRHRTEPPHVLVLGPDPAGPPRERRGR